jgi:hypothetical protein
VSQEEEPTEGRRVGIHPLIVVFGVIFGLWLFITLIIPKSKNLPNQGTGSTPQSPVGIHNIVSTDLIPTYEATGTVTDMKAITILVPPATTDSQVVALLQYFQKARLDNSLDTLLPPTTPGDKIGEFAIADIYIFSEPEYGVTESAKALGRGAHAPGEFYPSSIPYEVAMENVRGHYAIDLYNKNSPERASLGFGEDDTGVYSKRYQRVF